MMNNTYSLIISQSERAWSFQWARTLFALERRLSEKEKGDYLHLYSINIPSPTKSEHENNSIEDDNDKSQNEIKESQQNNKTKKFIPALMIINRMNFTQAERRRLIVGYWQVSIIFI